MQDMEKMKRKEDFAPILAAFQNSEKHTAVGGSLYRWAVHLLGCI